MLLFKPEHVGPILCGRKTETRRIWKRPRVKAGSFHLAKTKMLSKEYFARLEILDVHTEKLREITEEGAWAEGYNSREAYLHAFFDINQKATAVLLLIDPLVYVVKFRAVA